jgi:hypothetical protein
MKSAKFLSGVCRAADQLALVRRSVLDREKLSVFYKGTKDAAHYWPSLRSAGCQILAAKRTSAEAVRTWSRALLADQDGMAVLLDLQEL